MKPEQDLIKKLHEDALVAHFLGQGFSEDRARVETIKSIRRYKNALYFE